MSDTPITRVVEPRARDIGGFTVGRVLPALHQRAVGPFVFFDHMGPTFVPKDKNLDVRPHPHIGLATVTYLFAGQMHHRDTLGSSAIIQPGAINWMTAGRGIAHSERAPDTVRATGQDMHGLQLWVALPRALEEVEPAFDHYPAHTLPVVGDAGVVARVLAGSAYGVASPVRSASPTLYLDVTLPAGGSIELPADYPERAAFVVQGELIVGSERGAVRQMLVFREGARPMLSAEVPTRFVVIGGEPLDGPRHLWWNFVSSRPERIEQAKADWREGRFGLIPGDEHERIPLPDH
ncbi:MAG: pirin family protein [Deltaproteobacteria bacterium]|nr:pirin family protein [Deltaproteobacteria bacterium]